MTTWWLEMTDPAQLRPPTATSTELVVERLTSTFPHLGRELYRSVGHEWAWVDRLSWDDGQWRRRLEGPDVQTWVATLGGRRAGYFELESTEEGDIEIACFGLLKPFLGKGHGGHLLTQAVRHAWATRGAIRAWAHTCTLDAPHALQNYLARGFTVFRIEVQDRGGSVPLPPASTRPDRSGDR